MPTKKERLEALQRQMDEVESEPDEPSGSTRSLNTSVTIDLGDETQVKRAIKMGLLDKGDLGEFDDPAEGDGDADDEPTDDQPRRRQRYE